LFTLIINKLFHDQAESYENNLHLLDSLQQETFNMFRMMRAVPRMANMRQAAIKSQTVRAIAQKVSLTQASTNIPAMVTRKMSAKPQINQDFESKYIAYFNRPEIDGWQIRKGMGDLAAMDLVPEPQIVAAALRACRRINDFSLTSRILEVVRIKCGDRESEIWPYMLQALTPTLSELGIPTPALLGCVQPDLALTNHYEMN
jgi:cytochrome c oxidase subunit 5a